MQFTTFIMAALSVAFVAANPLPSPDLAARTSFDAEGLDPRAYWCTECKGGGKTCCTATQCSHYHC